MSADTQLPAYRPDHPAFAGHFPGDPIVPGVLLLDAAVHAAAGDTPIRIDAAKFLGVVRADEPLSVQLTPRGARQDFALRHGERAVATGTFAPAVAAQASP
jgi:3-hydroxymyristoyl/3-hydroxydecanoyl-(acyl carrier protein) dehydratase